MGKSAARDELKKFLKETPIGSSYIFAYPGNQLQAENYVQQMRVYLSKVRKKYKIEKRKYVEFKLIIEKVEQDIDIPVPDDPQKRCVKGVRITLKRENPNNLDSVLDGIDLG